MIRYAVMDDFVTLKNYDRHIREEELENCIKTGRVLVMFQDHRLTGWLRFNLFWDHTPFLNMLFLLEEFRGMGLGKELLRYWEHEMYQKQFDTVLTSTLSSEQAQFFYRKNGYVDCGSLLLPGEPLEILFRKRL